MNINDLIADNSLTIDPENEEFASNFTSLAGFKKTKAKERLSLRTWYEGYLFCVLVGLKENERKVLNNQSPKIKRNRMDSLKYRDQIKFCLSLILSRKDIINELGLNSRDTVKQYESVNSFFKKLMSICNEFAYGGLEYLKNEFEKDDTIFDSFTCYREILEQHKN